MVGMEIAYGKVLLLEKEWGEFKVLGCPQHQMSDGNLAGDPLECGCVSTGPSPTHSCCPRSQRWPPQSPSNTL